MKWLGDVVLPSVDEQMRATYIEEGYDKYFEYELRIIQDEKNKELIKELLYSKEGKEILSINYSRIIIGHEYKYSNYNEYIADKENKIPDEEMMRCSWGGQRCVSQVIFLHGYLDPKYKKFIKPCSYIRGYNVKENEIYELDIYKEKYDPKEDSFIIHRFAVINEIKVMDKKIFLEDEKLLECFESNLMSIADAVIINEKAEVFKDEEIKQKLIKDYKFDMKIRDKEEVYYRRSDYIFD